MVLTGWICYGSTTIQALNGLCTSNINEVIVRQSFRKSPFIAKNTVFCQCYGSSSGVRRNIWNRFGLGGRAMKMLRYELLQDPVGQGVSELWIFEKSNFSHFSNFSNPKSVNFGRRESVQLLTDAQWSYYGTRTQ